MLFSNPSVLHLYKNIYDADLIEMSNQLCSFGQISLVDLRMDTFTCFMYVLQVHVHVIVHVKFSLKYIYYPLMCTKYYTQRYLKRNLMLYTKLCGTTCTCTRMWQ